MTTPNDPTDNCGSSATPKMLTREHISEIARQFLRDGGVSVHQRRCCNDHGVRARGDIECDCSEHWDAIRQWCSNCGRTKLEILNDL